MSVQELQRDIQQHTEGVESVLSLCDALLCDEDAASGAELEGDSLQETSHSLDQRWRTICALALDRRLRWEPGHSAWTKPSTEVDRDATPALPVCPAGSRRRGDSGASSWMITRSLRIG